MGLMVIDVQIHRGNVLQTAQDGGSLRSIETYHHFGQCTYFRGCLLFMNLSAL